MDIAAVAIAQLAPLQTATPPVAPTSLATERFNAIMNAPDMGTVTGAVPSTATIAQAPITPLIDTTSPTLGNQILSGLRASAADFSQKWQNIDAMVKMS